MSEVQFNPLSREEWGGLAPRVRLLYNLRFFFIIIVRGAALAFGPES